MQVDPTDNIIIIDFEATCFEKTANIDRNEMEIIEFGAVLFDINCQVIDEYQSFIRPVKHPVLSDFCKELTGITQSDVDGAVGFTEAMSHFNKWLFTTGAKQWGSWGNFDKNIWTRQFRDHNMVIPRFVTLHTNLKEVFAKEMGYSKSKGIGASLHANDMVFEGSAHRALDDAKNIARLLKLIDY